MLRFILAAAAAAGRALKSTLGWFGGLIGTPIRSLFAAAFPGISEPPALPPITDAAEFEGVREQLQDLKRGEKDRVRVRVAQAAQTWALQSFSAGSHLEFPPAIPAGMRSWLTGLDREQLKSLGNSDSMAVAGHLTGDLRLPGLLPVRPLPRADIRRGPPNPEYGSGGLGLALINADAPSQPEERAGVRSGARRTRERNRAPSGPLPGLLGMSM